MRNFRWSVSGDKQVQVTAFYQTDDEAVAEEQLTRFLLENLGMVPGAVLESLIPGTVEVAPQSDRLGPCTLAPSLWEARDPAGPCLFGETIVKRPGLQIRTCSHQNSHYRLGLEVWGLGGKEDRGRSVRPRARKG